MNIKRMIAKVTAKITAKITKSFVKLIFKGRRHQVVTEGVVEQVHQSADKIRTEVCNTAQRSLGIGQKLAQVEKEILLWRVRALTEKNTEEQSLVCVRILQRFESRKIQLEQELACNEKLLQEVHERLLDVERQFPVSGDRRLTSVAGQAPGKLQNSVEQYVSPSGVGAQLDCWGETMIESKYLHGVAAMIEELLYQSGGSREYKSDIAR